MKTGAYVIFLSASLTLFAEKPETAPAAESISPSQGSAVHGRILEKLKQDAAKFPAKPKEPAAPFLNPNVPANDQPVAEGVLELEPFQVTKKKPIELPLRIDPITLDNFFYGDGRIWESANKRFSISSEPDALIKFNFKF